MPLTESIIEQAAIDWFTGLGYSYAYSKDIDPEGPHPERDSLEQVILPARLRAALARLNPSIPPAALIPQLDTLIHGFFERSRFLKYIRHFIVFEDDGRGQPLKIMAGYHQFHAVNVAVEETLRARRGTEEAEDDDIPFEEKMNALTAQLAEQFARGNDLQQRIRENLKGIGYEF